MFSFFKKQPKEKKTINVGEVNVTVRLVNGDFYIHTIRGFWFESGIGTMIKDAETLARHKVEKEWSCGSLFRVSKGIYVPIEDIKDIIIDPKVKDYYTIESE